MGNCPDAFFYVILLNLRGPALQGEITQQDDGKTGLCSSNFV